MTFSKFGFWAREFSANLNIFLLDFIAINAINVFKGDAKTVASSKKVEGTNKCHDWDGGGGTFVPYLGDG